MRNRLCYPKALCRPADTCHISIALRTTGLHSAHSSRLLNLAGHPAILCAGYARRCPLRQGTGAEPARWAGRRHSQRARRGRWFKNSQRLGAPQRRLQLEGLYQRRRFSPPRRCCCWRRKNLQLQLQWPSSSRSEIRMSAPNPPSLTDTFDLAIT